MINKLRQWPYSVWMVLLALTESCQWTMLWLWVMSQRPFPSSAFVESLYPYFQLDVHPEWDMAAFRLAVALALIFAFILMKCFREEVVDDEMRKRFAGWLMMSGLMLGMALQLYLWSVLNPQLTWAKPLMGGIMVLAMLSRLFFNSMMRLGPMIWEHIQFGMRQWVMPNLDLIMPVVIVLIIVPVSMPSLLAMIYATDQFYHLDGFVMSAIWALKQGLILNQDVISQYGSFIPKMFKLFMDVNGGGIRYENLIGVMVALTLVYWLILYAWMRRCFHHTGVAAWGILLAIKWQMFHAGVWPVIWRYGTPTVLRHFWDVGILWFLNEYLRQDKKRFLFLAAAFAGWSISYMLDTGLYIAFALGVFIILDLASGLRKTIKSKQEIFPILLKGAGAGFALLLGCVSGWTISTEAQWLDPTFWRNTLEHAALFLNGYGSLPLTAAIDEKQYYCFFKGLLIPLFLMGIGAWHAFRFWEKGERMALLFVTIAVYGLALYHYYINRSAFTSFDVVCIPVVLLMMERLCALTRKWRNGILVLLFLGLCSTWIPNIQWQNYPNVFHASRPMNPALNQWLISLDTMDDDAKMIEKWTNPNERLAMVTSLDVMWLMKSKRSPYFYYTPMMESTPLHDLSIRGTYLHHQARWERTLKQMSDTPPRTWIVDNKLLNPEVVNKEKPEESVQAMLAWINRQGYQKKVQGRWVSIFQK